MKTKYLGYILAISVIGGIKNVYASNEQPQTNNQAQAITAPPSSVIYQDNLARLMAAELALQQENPDLAIENYLAILKSNPDAKIAELALECTIKYKNFTKAVEVAVLWANFAPNDINPQIIAATLILDNLPEQAKIYLSRALTIEPIELDQYLLLTYKKLPTAAQKTLYTILTELVAENLQNPHIHVAAAQIAAQENQIATAEELIAKALKLAPTLTHAIELNAKLIRHTTGKDLPALKYLQAQLKKNPSDEELKMFYSNALLDNNNFAAATPYLQQLTKSAKYTMEAKFILGDMLLTQKKHSKAYSLLLDVVDDPIYGTNAKYSLAKIAEAQNKITDAIKWYSEVKEGQMHIPATLKAAMLLTTEGSYAQALQLIQEASPTNFAEQKQLLLVELDILVETKEIDHAMKLANDAITVVPADLDFLYARSLIASLLSKPEIAEQDLQTILSIDPEHANALNALGYTLSNQPARNKEAIAYLQKALELAPNNPAFMDSMGWVLFRAGKIQDSMALLTDAYKLSKDGEIAAHLGEVLWTSGKKEQAKKIWHEALRHAPNHDILLDTLNRLDVKLNLSME